MVDSQKAYLLELLEIAARVDALGRECADSVTVVLTGGETITFVAGDTCINVAGEPTLWYVPEPR